MSEGTTSNGMSWLTILNPRRWWALLAWMLLAVPSFAAVDAAGQRIYRIMPVGDSITEGSSAPGAVSYRYALWEKLFSAGYLVEYVGSRTNESRIGPLRHEGYGGRTAEFLATHVGAGFKETPADVVLIHAGHNHATEEHPGPNIVAATEVLIGRCRDANPEVIILLAQVIPSGKLPKYDYLPDLNKQLAKLASRLNTPKQPVLLVDQARDFDWTTDTVADHVHPNQRGATKMAQRWFEALTKVLEPPVQSFHAELIMYKRASDSDLTLHLFRPPGAEGKTRRPAIIFFFGGGWVRGTPIQFYPECAHFAAEGFVAISADYRIASVQRTTPFESVADGKSAIRWVRQHADELGVDVQRIVAAGASAGGQVAAATGFVPGLDDPGEDHSVSSHPNALALWYAVIDNGPGGYGYDRVKDRFREISPLHNMIGSPLPAIFFLGTEDRLIPVRTAEDFKARLEKLGGRCELKLFPGRGHPIENYRQGDSVFRREMLRATDDFLASIGFRPPAVAASPEAPGPGKGAR